MKIRMWSAFASNNSGSYTIVGDFPSPERAAEVARVLTPLLAAQTRWVAEGRQPPSPLELFAGEQHLAVEVCSQDWPEYGAKDTPEVVAFGRQVLLHHDYTVSLPRFFGAYFYARGGSVQTCLDHAHVPLVALCEADWAWDDAGRDEHQLALAEELSAHLGLALVIKAGLAP